MILVAIFILVYFALGVIAWRRPLLARLAVREAVRRPWQSVLVVAGLTVGTSMILMSLVNSDSMTVSLTRATYQSWGRVDLLVSANGSFFSPEVATGLAASSSLQGKVRGVQGGVELVGPVVDLNKRLDNPAVRLIGFDPVSQPAFGSFRLADGQSTTGGDLAPNQVLLSQSLASSLQAQKGDSVRVAGNGFGPADFKVAGIAKPDGPGAYGAQPAIFATLATMTTLTGTDQINVIRVSALGDGQQELDNSKRLAPQVIAALTDVTAGQALHVRAAKADDVNEIIKLAASNAPTILALSFIIVLAGVALVVNLAVALAEERRQQLAVLRALGLSRTGLVATAVIEGGLYSLAAAAIGAVPGILAAWLLVSQAGRWVPEVHEKNATVLFVISTQSIAISIAAGALITFAAILIASIRTSRLAIASAVRELPDPASPNRSMRLRTGGSIALAMLGLVATTIGDSGVRLVGGLAVIAAIGLLTRGRLPNRARASLIAVAAVVWVGGIYSTLTETEIETNPLLTIIALASAIAALSAVVAANMRVIERFVPRPLVAQLTRRPAKLALAISSLGLVLALVAFIDVFLAGVNPNYRKDAGGYDVSVVSMNAPSISLPPELESNVAAAITVSTNTYLGPVRSSSSDRGPGPLDWHQQLVPLYQLTGSQLVDGYLPLESRDPRFSNDGAVWAAIRNDPRLVLSGVYRPGTTVELIGKGGPVQLRVAGSFRSGLFAGLMGSTASLAPLISGPSGTTLLLRLRPGVDPGAFAFDVRRSMFPTGVQAITTRDLLDLGNATFKNFAAEINLLLSAGVAVGVFSLGVLALRAVVERRRTIGLLRAVGYQPRQLLVAVVGESLLTSAAGVFVGIVGGLGLGHFVVARLYPGGEQGFEAGSFSVVVAVVLITAVAVTAAPALAVARIAPAEALRLVD